MKRRILSCIILLLFVTNVFAQSTAERYKAYIAKYAAWAQDQQREHGVPAAITLAQGLLESAAGSSTLATKANNHFGIKCGDNWDGATYRHQAERGKECFRKYRSAEESYRDHSLFLKRKRYAPLFELKVTDYKGWAHGLKRCGYATDPQYASKLIKIIETYDLAQYSKLDDKKSKKDKKRTESQPTKRVEKQKRTHQEKEVRTSKPTPAPTPTPQEKAVVEAEKTAVVPATPTRMGSVELIIEHEVLRNNGKRYVIAREGDTFLSIAYEFNMYDSTLRRYNDIVNPRYELQPGDKVYLQKKKKKAARKYATYRVKRNENIWQIAQDKGMRLETIYALNGIPEGENVTINQELRLR